MRIVILSICILLQSCSTLSTNDFRPSKDIMYKNIQLHWVLVDDVNKICSDLIPKFTNLFVHLDGCASWTDNSCTIYTGTTTNVDILGHEIRHCFEGNFHK